MKLVKNWHFKANTLALSVAAAMLVASGAQAQEKLEEIQVTGTRIRTTDGMVTPTPVTAVSTDELKMFEPSASISEQLDQLPQFLNTQTAQRGGGTLFGDAAGSYLNLRNMGKQRTLVLFDGSRVVPADRASTVNVDNFPTALIRTVDVVTGGASAAYGADALAGVVNFVLDREFEGFKSNLSTGITGFGDGQNWNFSVAGGKQIGDRLHLVGSVEHREIKQIERTVQDQENWNSTGFIINPAWKSTDPAGTTPQRLTVAHAHSATQNAAGIVTATAAAGKPAFSLNGYTFSADGKSLRPFVAGDYKNRIGAGSNGMQAGGPEAAIAESSFAGGPYGAEVIQHSGFGGIKYDLNDNTEIFGQIMMGRTESNQHGRRGNPEMGQQYFGTIYIENPFMPEELRTAMNASGLTSVRFDKIGQVRGPNKINVDNRGSNDISQMWSASAGFETALPNDWNLRGTYQYGESQLTSEGNNYIRNDHWYMAMDAVRNPKTGAIMCNVQLRNPSMAELEAAAVGKTVPSANIIKYPSGVQPIDNILVTPMESIRDCAPLNVFGTGNFSQEAVEYVTSDKKGIRDLDQTFAEVLVTGELYEGWGAGPMTFAGGLTYREEWFNQLTTPIAFERSTLNADALGIRGTSVGISGGNRSVHNFSATSWATGAFDVWEWFSEVNLPVWESGSGAQRIDSTVAFRRSDYSHSGTIDSWKIGSEFQVIEDLRLRVTKSRDVREPTFGEQFESGGGGANITDPVDKSSYTITLLTGGNANLRPEVADTITGGFVYAPTFASWIEGLSVSADYFEIAVAGRVSTLGSQRVIDDCFKGDKALCNLVTRNAASGKIERVLDVNLNVSAAMNKGVDIEARYDLEPDFFSSEAESMNFRMFAGRLLENSVTTTVYQDNLGSNASPEWTANVMMGYNLGNFGLNLSERYYDSTKYNVTWSEGVQVDDNTIASQSVTNMGISYRGETGNGGNWVTSFNVNNLFDRNPPIFPSESQRGGQQPAGNNFDVFGRRFQLNLNYNF